MLAKDIKPGAVVVYNDAPVMITGISVQSPSARGAATLYKFRARNLVSKQKVDLTLKGTDSLPEADFQRRSVKFMYADATQSHFLDEADYNQFALDSELIEEERQYITEELEGMVAMIYNDECVGIQLPTTVTLQVVECDPAVKGDSATKRTKPAKLQTGLVIYVPEYLTSGEMVKVDTRTGEFLSRA
ncbi:MAG: elongation factor P [Pirellulales bacterium]